MKIKGRLLFIILAFSIFSATSVLAQNSPGPPRLVYCEYTLDTNEAIVLEEGRKQITLIDVDENGAILVNVDETIGVIPSNSRRTINNILMENVESLYSETQEIEYAKIGIHDENCGAISVEEDYPVPPFVSCMSKCGKELMKECYNTQGPSELLKCTEPIQGICEERCSGLETMCDSGCLFEDACLSTGTRTSFRAGLSGVYCSFDGLMQEQKLGEEFCENNFECVTNSCKDSKCTELGLWKRFVKWLSGFW